jgi:hypothetical protein
MVDYKDIPERVKVVGKLGRPLAAELTTIRGRWMEVGRAKPSGPVFVVNWLNGKDLDRPVEFNALEPVFASDAQIVPLVGEQWELRGVETGGFVGFIGEARREIESKIAQPGSPGPSGFLTKFCYLSSKRLRGD